MINTPFGRGPRSDGYFIRTATATAGVPCITTLPGVFAAVRGIEALRGGPSEPRSLQEHHEAASGGASQVAALVRGGGRVGRGRGRMKRVRAEILSTRKLGAYHSITLVAPEIAERARPGQFLAIQMPEGREFLLRRHFAVHQASRRGGWAGTLEFVVDPSGPGTEWLGKARAHEFLDVIGPLGKGFAYPKRLTNCLLVGGRARRGIALLLGAGADRAAQTRRHDRRRRVTGAGLQADRRQAPVADDPDRHADGSLGERGSVLDALPEMVDRSAGRRCSTRQRRPRRSSAIAGFCRERQIPAQVVGRGADGVRVRPLLHVRGARSRARTAAGTTTSGRASTARCSIRRACSGIGGSPMRRRCCRRPLRDSRWCARGRGETLDRRRPGRTGARDARHGRRPGAPEPAASSPA